MESKGEGEGEEGGEEVENVTLVFRAMGEILSLSSRFSFSSSVCFFHSLYEPFPSLSLCFIFLVFLWAGQVSNVSGWPSLTNPKN